jgi:hypothetical protein
LREFCRSGKFGLLGIGSREAEVIEYLGQPTSWANTKPEDAKFCHYGDVQFFFDRLGLSLIHIDWFSGAHNTPSLSIPHQLEPWMIREGASLEEIQDAFHAESLLFQSECSYGSIVLRLTSGALIYFDEDTRKLNAVSVMKK